MAYTTIDDPSAYFHTQLYTGNGSSQTVTNDANAGDFKPDWIWVKNRSTADSNMLSDSSRGSTKALVSEGNGAEFTPTNGNLAFLTDGFSFGSNNNYNRNTDSFVAWQWKANGGSLTTAAESGSNVGYSRQVNTTSGFAIIKYTGIGSGAAVIHGMGATPSFFTVKNLGGGGWSWYTYHHKNTSSPNTENLYLNNTDATADMDTVWNDQYPSSTEIKLGTNGGVNADGNEYIMYAFAEKQGYSKFGSYTGNGHATDGPFVYLGFKPAWLLYRNVSRAENWLIEDNKRNTFNRVAGAKLQANVTDAETSETRWGFDFLSNGFKVRNTESQNANNGSGETIIYMAFAEHPFVSSKGVPTTAR